jgi:hypothetical protein
MVVVLPASAERLYSRSAATNSSRRVRRRIDRMRAAGLPLDVVAYSAPEELHAVIAAERRG